MVRSDSGVTPSSASSACSSSVSASKRANVSTSPNSGTLAGIRWIGIWPNTRAACASCEASAAPSAYERDMERQLVRSPSRAGRYGTFTTSSGKVWQALGLASIP